MRSPLYALTLTLTFALALPALGCKKADRTLDKATEVAANVVLPPADETALGRQLVAQLESEVKLHPDPEVQQYIQELGNEMVRAAGDRVPEGITFTFKVIDEPETINAFAMPGGFIYFYSGLLLKADNTSEVIGVMGHEVSHVTERHVAERLVKAYGLEMLLSIALGRNPGQVKQIVAGLLAQGYLLKYGRDQEREADTIGLSYVLRDGQYDPIGMATFFQKLDEAGPSAPSIVSSHPDPGERATRIKQLIREQGQVPSDLGKERFSQLYPKFKGSGAPMTPPSNEIAPAVTPAP